MLGKIRELIVNNKLYFWLVVFILVINLLVFVDRKVQEAGEKKEAAVRVEEEPAQEKPAMFGEEDAEARQEKLEKLAKENPVLYMFLALLNLTIIFMLLVGIGLDVYFLVRFVKKRPVDIRIRQQEDPKWGIGDVVRVTLLFLAFGYVFVIVQSFFAGLFPILRNENFRMIFNTAMMNVVGISVIVYFITRKHGQDIEAIGITGKRVLGGIFYAVIGYLALVPVLILIMVGTFLVTKWLAYKPPVQPIVQVFMEEKETAILWLSTLFAAVFGPIAEEIFFRGFMYKAIKKSIGIFWAMVITSAIFSFLHTHIVGFLPIMVLGMLLAYLYEKTGSLVPSMTVHIIHNVGMVILVFLIRNIGV